MKIRLLMAFAIAYLLVESVVVLASYVLGHILLQMSMMDVYIVTGFLILATTLGAVVGTVISLAKRKKQ